MNLVCLNAYNCLFRSSKGDKNIKVAARNMVHAVRTAQLVISLWEDRDAYELSCVSIIEPISFLGHE